MAIPSLVVKTMTGGCICPSIDGLQTIADLKRKIIELGIEKIVPENDRELPIDILTNRIRIWGGEPPRILESGVRIEAIIEELCRTACIHALYNQ